MLIQLEADFPNPLVKALQSALSAHPDGPITVEKAISDDAPVQDTVVFMINRDKKRIAPAIQQRVQQGYRVFALRQSSGDESDPFWLTMRILGLLWKIVDIIEIEKETFIYSLQLGKRLITKVTLAPIGQAPPLKQIVKRKKRTRSRTDSTLNIFPIS